MPVPARPPAARPDRPASRPTAKDVARAAGVSQSTVSLVLAGKWAGRVSDATAGAVRQAADALGYRPNLAARSLRLGSSRTVMLVVPALTSPFFGAVHTGAARAAAARDFAVVAFPSRDGEPAPRPFATAHGALDGVLASSLAADALAAVHDGTGLPLVMLDSEPRPGVPSVTLDVAGALREVTAHLAALGHRRFGRLVPTVRSWTFDVRDAAFREVVAALPGARCVATVAGSLADVGEATAAARLLLDRPDRPTAVVCDDDVLAVGAVKAARALGLAVPGDLSVTGLDDLQISRATEPELTTVRLPGTRLGAAGMEALLDLLDGGAPANRVLPGELVVRGSTGPAPV